MAENASPITQIVPSTIATNPNAIAINSFMSSPSLSV